MKLSYRGVHYTYEPLTLEVTEGEILGKYRGTGWHCHTLKEMPTPQPDVLLRYRGVAYNPSRLADTCQKLAVPVSKPVAARRIGSATALAARQAIEEMHRENLRRNLERRLQAARERGDQTLVSLLEAESRQLLV